MKKTAIIILVLVVAFFVYLKMTPATAPVGDNMKTYNNSELGISFVYPTVLSASATGNVVTLHHEIPYTNTGECDMMGDEETFENLTDFRVAVQVSNKGLVATMQEKSSYIPQENFVDNMVVPSPGFIDAFSVGELDGFAIYEGAEGCGQVAYYFPLGDNKTLYITKMSVQVLSGVVSAEKEAEVLKVPGVISRAESEKIFQNILLTLEVK